MSDLFALTPRLNVYTRGSASAFMFEFAKPGSIHEKIYKNHIALFPLQGAFLKLLQFPLYFSVSCILPGCFCLEVACTHVLVVNASEEELAVLAFILVENLADEKGWSNLAT